MRDRLRKSSRDKRHGRSRPSPSKGLTETVAQLEAEIDQAAAELWGITNEELKAIQQALKEMEKGKRQHDDEESDEA